MPNAYAGIELGRDTGIDRRKRRASSSSLMDSRTFAGDNRAVTLRDSGPWLMNQLYRSSLELAPPGWRKITMALLEPGRLTETPQTTPSGARNVFAAVFIAIGSYMECLRRRARQEFGVRARVVQPTSEGESGWRPAYPASTSCQNWTSGSPRRQHSSTGRPFISLGKSTSPSRRSFSEIPSSSSSR
jgi:hypothetical protein